MGTGEAQSANERDGGESENFSLSLNSDYPAGETDRKPRTFTPPIFFSRNIQPGQNLPGQKEISETLGIGESNESKDELSRKDRAEKEELLTQMRVDLAGMDAKIAEFDPEDSDNPALKDLIRDRDQLHSNIESLSNSNSKTAFQFASNNYDGQRISSGNFTNAASAASSIKSMKDSSSPEYVAEKMEHIQARDRSATKDRNDINGLRSKYGMDTHKFDGQYSEIDKRREAAKARGDLFGYSGLTLERRHLENKEALDTVDGVIKNGGSQEDVDKGLTTWMSTSNRRLDELKEYDEIYKKEQERLKALLDKAPPGAEKEKIATQMQTMSATYQHDRQKTIETIRSDNEKAVNLATAGASTEMIRNIQDYVKKPEITIVDEKQTDRKTYDGINATLSPSASNNTNPGELDNTPLTLDLTDDKPLSAMTIGEIKNIQQTMKKAAVVTRLQDKPKEAAAADIHPIKLAVEDASHKDNKSPSQSPAQPTSTQHSQPLLKDKSLIL